MQTKKVDEYYVGFDIGTNSVGYAVTDKNYNLIKHGGEPMWGSHVFEAALTAQERRAFRTARRRNDRKKQRIVLVSEILGMWYLMIQILRIRITMICIQQYIILYMI